MHEHGKVHAALAGENGWPSVCVSGVCVCVCVWAGVQVGGGGGGGLQDSAASQAATLVGRGLTSLAPDAKQLCPVRGGCAAATTLRGGQQQERTPSTTGKQKEQQHWQQTLKQQWWWPVQRR